MSDTNCIGTVIKLLEKPVCQTIHSKYNVIEIRAQIPQKREKQIVLLTLWGKLATEFLMKYKKNDYLLVSGYVSIPIKTNKNKKSKKFRQVKITVTKVYPFLFSL